MEKIKTIIKKYYKHLLITLVIICLLVITSRISLCETKPGIS